MSALKVIRSAPPHIIGPLNAFDAKQIFIGDTPEAFTSQDISSGITSKVIVYIIDKFEQHPDNVLLYMMSEEEFIQWFDTFLIELDSNKIKYLKGLQECPICSENKSCVKTKCGHVICKKCIMNWKRTSNTCPLCRSKDTFFGHRKKSRFLVKI